MVDDPLDIVTARIREAWTLPPSRRRVKMMAHLAEVHLAMTVGRAREALAEAESLRTQLAEVTRERDDLWRRFNSSQDSNRTLAAMAGDEKRRADAAEARLAAALKVVEAAKAWRAGWNDEWMKTLNLSGRTGPSKVAGLIAAIDAHEEPSTPLVLGDQVLPCQVEES